VKEYRKNLAEIKKLEGKLQTATQEGKRKKTAKIKAKIAKLRAKLPESSINHPTLSPTPRETLKTSRTDDADNAQAHESGVAQMASASSTKTHHISSLYLVGICGVFLLITVRRTKSLVAVPRPNLPRVRVPKVPNIWLSRKEAALYGRKANNLATKSEFVKLFASINVLYEPDFDTDDEEEEDSLIGAGASYQQQRSNASSTAGNSPARWDIDTQNRRFSSY
jgi:hypothetical protein